MIPRNPLNSHLSTLHTFDTANRLLEDSNFTYTYDANGNLTEKRNKATGDLTRYTYDPENQLIRVERFTLAGGATPVLVADYKYDALGRRIEKVVNGVSTQYVYDNEDIIVEFNAPSPTPAVYIHGPGIDEPLAMFRSMRGNSLFVYHADGLGSITTITDAFGAPARTYTYDSFGRIVAETGTVSNPFTYTGREFDPETGLDYYRTRYYDPSIGRFLDEDTFGGILHLPQGFNRFSYTMNNPTTFLDPNGRLVLADDLVLILLAGGAGAATILSDPEIQRIAGQFLREVLENIEKGQPITPEDIEKLGKPPQGLICQVRTPSDFPPPQPDPNDPRSPNFWDRPADWHKLTKWQKFRWFAGKVGIVVSQRLGP